MTPLNVEILPLPGGTFGYTVEAPDGSVSFRQEFAPGQPGFLAMTEQQARDYAAAQVLELQAYEAPA